MKQAKRIVVKEILSIEDIVSPLVVKRPRRQRLLKSKGGRLLPLPLQKDQAEIIANFAKQVLGIELNDSQIKMVHASLNGQWVLPSRNSGRTTSNQVAFEIAKHNWLMKQIAADIEAENE